MDFQTSKKRLVCFSRILRHFGAFTLLILAAGLMSPASAQSDSVSVDEIKLIKAAETARIATINKVYGAVVAVYGTNQQGGGSGVIFDPSGLALTNHHVIMGAGASGKAGLADGNLYDWDLIGTDPGGDLAIIKLKGKKAFPFAKLGDSDKVRVGDFAMAMGNPFILAEDQTPTVTLGIVSGIKRYQEGAGKNELVYGNCIQVDSSINPGNSGGPLFNMNSEVIGINGRGSFKKRGRVNVGLGYAISVNQIKYFIPELLSTKLVEHGTLDASFGERGGKIVCERLSLDAPIAKAGLIPGSELIAFEGIPMTTVDQFTNLISTLPEDWPAEVTFLDEDNQQQTAHVRLFGLPYAPKKAAAPKQPKIPTPDQRKKMQRAQAMMKVLTHPAGQIRDKELNRLNCQRILDDWKTLTVTDASIPGGIKIEDQIVKNGEQIGKQTILISRGGKFRVEHEVNAVKTAFVFDGETFEKKTADDEIAKLSHLQARLTPEIVQATTLCNVFHEKPFAIFGDVLLDGADKAQKKIAYRVKTLDKGGDWFFVWLSLENDKGEREVRLLKASADKNADGESGAVSFLDWREFGGMQIPYRRDFVNGLEEKIGFQAFTINVSPVSELTDDLFKLSVEEE